MPWLPNCHFALDTMGASLSCNLYYTSNSFSYVKSNHVQQQWERTKLPMVREITEPYDQVIIQFARYLRQKVSHVLVHWGCHWQGFNSHWYWDSNFDQLRSPCQWPVKQNGQYLQCRSKVSHINFMDFLRPPLGKGAELHYKLSTTSKVCPSPPGRLEENPDLNLRNIWPALYLWASKYVNRICST